MPFRLIVALIIALLAPGAAAHNFVTGKRVTPVYIQEGGELLLNNDEIHYQKWNSTQLAGKSPHYPVYRRAQVGKEKELTVNQSSGSGELSRRIVFSPPPL